MGGYSIQTCYSNGNYFTEIKDLIPELYDAVDTLRSSVDPTANKTDDFNYDISNKLYNNLFSLLEKCAQKDKHVYIYLDPFLYGLPINALLTKPSQNLN